MSTRVRAVLAVLAVTAAVLAVIELQAPTGVAPAVSRPVQGPLEACPLPSGQPAGHGKLPDLSFPCVAGGPDVALAAAPGVPTVLTVWAAWCAPCRTDLPLFQRLHEQAPQTVRVTGLVERDTLVSTLAYAEDVRLSFPSSIDATGKLLTDEGLDALPFTYFLRADGSVAYRNIGPIASYDVLRQLVADHLGVTVPT